MIRAPCPAASRNRSSRSASRAAGPITVDGPYGEPVFLLWPRHRRRGRGRRFSPVRQDRRGLVGLGGQAHGKDRGDGVGRGGGGQGCHQIRSPVISSSANVKYHSGR